MNKFARLTAAVGLWHACAPQLSQAQPFESVLTQPIVSVPALDNRSVATIRTNASSSRAFVTAGGPPTPGNPGFLHVTIWNDKGGVFSFSAYDFPGTNGSFDARSISEDPNGNFYVTGYCSSAAVSASTFIAKFDSNLGFLWCRYWGGADTSDPRVRCVALSSGGVVIMEPINSAGSNQSHTRMTCFTAAGQHAWQKEYTTSNCDAIRVADMVEVPDGTVYAVGRLKTAAPFSTACVLAVDPDPTGGNGQALGLWTIAPSLGFNTDFLSVDVGLQGDLIVAGTTSFFGVPGPGFSHVTRIARLRTSPGMSAASDAAYFNAPMLPAIGAAAFVPSTFGGNWAVSPVFAVGGNGAGPAGNLMRVDVYSNLAFLSGGAFGGGSPVTTSFFDVALNRLQPAEVVLAGVRVPVPAGTEEAYLVRTGPFGASSCSAPWTATATAMSTTTTSLTPVTLAANAWCVGNSGLGPPAVTSIALPSHVFSASVTYKKKCDAAICSGDLNHDSMVDDSDFVVFAPMYDILLCHEAAMPEGCPADLNIDGFVDDDDFQIFASAYNILTCDE